MTSNSGGNLNESNLEESSRNIAVEFQNELNSILETRPPISKEKMNHIVKEALKEIRHYKHVVYYVESFIKNCSSEYKIPGLYVIDAIIRNSKSSQSNNHKEMYTNRFSKNMCKTFNNLYSKCPDSDREKIGRVLQLWQKYNILDAELIDKLNRISSMSTIDCAINSNQSSENVTKKSNESNEADKLKRLNYLQHKLAKLQEQQKHSSKVTIDDKLISEIHKLSSQLLKTKNAPSTTPPITTKTEINKILDFENDLDSDSDNNNRSINDNESTSTNENKLKRKLSTSSTAVVFNEDGLNSSERFKKSIDNCAAWLKTMPEQSQSQGQEAKKINLPDLTQPPPPLLTYYNKQETPTPQQQFSYQFPQTNSSSVDSILLSASKRMKPSTPPLPPPPPPPTFKEESHQNNDSRHLAREKERDRSRRGLPNIREKHISICSKTLWLGHLSKTTTEDYVIDELTELLSPSSSSNDDSKRKLDNSSNNKSNNIIVDCQLIPPRGCAYVEFIDRKTASKCLERMKDGYRLDGNSIKVAWATNKGINKDRQIKLYWNVEVGCTYVPWSDLDAISSIDFIKWAEGGLIDEDSIPEKYFALFKKQMLQLANSDTSETKNDLDHSKSQVHDMDLETDDDNHSHPQQQQTINYAQQLQQHHTQTIHLPPPPLPSHPPPHIQQLIPTQTIQIPPHLLNSDLLNHLRNNSVPPPHHTSDSSNLQLQFLSGLPGASTQPTQLNDIQSALAHFQQINSQNQQSTVSNSNTQSSQLLNRAQQPSHNTSQGQMLLPNGISFDLLQRNQAQSAQAQNSIQLLQPQLIASNSPFGGAPQHFQLVQRPLLISQRQANPANLTSLTNLLTNPNQSQLQLFSSIQSPQQQRLNLQMRNILASVGAAPPLNQSNPAANSPYFLSSNTKLPQMIFLNENQFHQEISQQQAPSQQQLINQPTTTKSPIVTSTTESNGQSLSQQFSSTATSETSQLSPQNLKSLMDMNFDSKFVEKNSDTSYDVNESKGDVYDEKLANNDAAALHSGYKNSSNYDRFNSNNSSFRSNSRRSYPSNVNHSRSYDYYNNSNKQPSYNKSSKNWNQNNWQQSNKRSFSSSINEEDSYKRNSSYNNKLKSSSSSDYTEKHETSSESSHHHSIHNSIDTENNNNSAKNDTTN